MPTRPAQFHDEAAAEYDAAFDWYLERSPDAALKFDAEVERALAHDRSGPSALGARTTLDPQVLAQTIPFYSDLPGTDFSGYSNRGCRPHQPKAWILEATAVGKLS
jgi:hypothetical protein